MRYLAIIGMVLTLTTSMSDPASLPDNTLQTVSSIANIVYTGLTVVIVIVAIWSLALTRKQMRENKKQSDAALAASAKQSQAAIDAVHEQIKASEQQSQASIDVVYEQIKASERQAQEAIHSQQKPVIIPTSSVEAIYVPNSATSGKSYRTIDLENAGLGIALNVWGTVASLDAGGKYYCSVQSSFLIPHEIETVRFGQEEFAYPYAVFDVFNLFPMRESGYDTRLMLTYKDVFDNKYLTVFDKSPGFGWKQVTLKKVERTMYEVAEEMSLHKHGQDELFPPWA